MARFPADYDYDPVDSDEECASAAATQHTGCVRFSSVTDGVRSVLNKLSAQAGLRGSVQDA